MSKINFKKERIPFTQVANSVLQSNALSVGAKAMYAYLYSKPEGWDFSHIRIAKEFKEGHNTILRYLKELETNGLLTRSKLSTGRMIYEVHVPPVPSSKPNTKYGGLGSDKTEAKHQIYQTGKSGDISNKDRTKVIAEQSSAEDTPKFTSLGAEIIKGMESVDPKNKTYYQNTTQRAAADFLIEEYGLDLVLQVIALLPKTNTMEFFPSVTTPCQLRDKWVQLQSALERKKKEISKPKFV